MCHRRPLVRPRSGRRAPGIAGRAGQPSFAGAARGGEQAVQALGVVREALAQRQAVSVQNANLTKERGHAVGKVSTDGLVFLAVQQFEHHILGGGQR